MAKISQLDAARTFRRELLELMGSLSEAPDATVKSLLLEVYRLRIALERAETKLFREYQLGFEDGFFEVSRITPPAPPKA